MQITQGNSCYDKLSKQAKAAVAGGRASKRDKCVSDFFFFLSRKFSPVLKPSLGTNLNLSCVLAVLHSSLDTN